MFQSEQKNKRTAPLRTGCLKKNKKHFRQTEDKNKRLSCRRTRAIDELREYLKIKDGTYLCCTQWQKDRQTVTMVKITFQSVAGQKVEKDNDVDKSEILIPHAVVSDLHGPLLLRSLSVCHFLPTISFLSVCARPACRPAPARQWSGGLNSDRIHRHLDANKTCIMSPAAPLRATARCSERLRCL